MKIVVTIPAYNEEASISKVIAEIKNVMSKEKFSYDILVVDDGSTDNTASLARKAGAIVISNHHNMGLAETFKREMRECLKLNPDVIVHTDADGQYPASYIPELIRKIKQGNDIVLGSRFGRGSYRGSLSKRLGNWAFAKVFSRMLGTRVKDTTTGFRAFRPVIAEFPLINTFTYTQEQLIRAGYANMRIAEVPIRTRKTRKSRLFKNSFDYALKAWVNIMRIYRDFAPLKFFGMFGALFMGLGLLLGAWITYTWLTTGTVGGLPRVIFSMLLITTGVQIGLFGFLADMNRR
jgi:glycosyltransferase involved in cell wall biosynthesis